MQKILVWDVPTRVFHWSLALSFLGAYISGDSERWRDLHIMFGYTMLGLIVFRLVWGIIGTRYARFSLFLYGPGRVLAYLKSLLGGENKHYVGHNPAGSWAIFAILGLGLLAGLSGYATYQELGGEWLEELHEGAANTLLAVVIVHILGVIISSVLHHENLVRSMLTGYKAGEPGTAVRHAHWLLGAVLLLAVLAYWTRLF